MIEWVKFYTNNKRIMNWKDVFFATPGPKTAKETIILIIKGLCMGTADVIPGVSGGTIALIMGIYEDLLLAINSIDISMVKKLLRGNIKDALSKVHLRFLFFLLMGIGIAILSLARIMNYLIHNQAVLTWSLFFGLIAASIFVVGKKVKNWAGSPAISFLAGGTAAWFIVGLIPVSTPEEFWFIFLSGFIAIFAMILPGLSGAFLLLILGKYEFMVIALKNPFLISNFLNVVYFCSVAFLGIISELRVFFEIYFLFCLLSLPTILMILDNYQSVKEDIFPFVWYSSLISRSTCTLPIFIKRPNQIGYLLLYFIHLPNR